MNVYYRRYTRRVIEARQAELSPCRYPAGIRYLGTVTAQVTSITLVAGSECPAGGY